MQIHELACSYISLGASKLEFSSSRRFQKFPVGSRRFQLVSEVFRRPQKVPEGFKRFQKISEGSRRLNKVQECMQIQELAFSYISPKSLT